MAERGWLLEFLVVGHAGGLSGNATRAAAAKAKLVI
jgi:hypothetical protein